MVGEEAIALVESKNKEFSDFEKKHDILIPDWYKNYILA